MSRDDYPPVVKYEGADMTTDTLRVLFSSAQDPRSWNLNIEAGTDTVITCITHGDAKRAEEIFNSLQHKLAAANQRIASLEQEKKAAAIKALEDAADTFGQSKTRYITQEGVKPNSESLGERKGAVTENF